MGIFFLLLVIVACAGNPPALSQDIPQNLSAQRTVVLYPEQGAESPRMILTFHLTGDFAGKLRPFIRDLLYEGMSPEVYAEHFFDSTEKRYRDTRITLESNPDFPMESMNWEYTELIEVRALHSPYMLVSRNREYYTGGAHGMLEKRYFVIDTTTAALLRLEDIVKDGAVPALTRIVEAELRIGAGLEPGDPLSQGGFFEDSAVLPENFFFLPEGLGFHWDPYEIAPYVMGPIEVIIPYGSINNILSPRGLILAEEKS